MLAPSEGCVRPTPVAAWTAVPKMGFTRFGSAPPSSEPRLAPAPLGPRRRPASSQGCGQRFLEECVVTRQRQLDAEQFLRWASLQSDHSPGEFLIAEPDLDG